MRTRPRVSGPGARCGRAAARTAGAAACRNWLSGRARTGGVPSALHAAARAADPRRGRSLLRDCGAEVMPVRESHLCCGSAGTYSLLQPELSGATARAQARSTARGRSRRSILSANVGCIAHLAARAPVTVQPLDRMAGCSTRGCPSSDMKSCIICRASIRRAAPFRL